MYMYYYDSPMGVMKLCADEESLLGVWFDEERISEASLDIEVIENFHDNKHIAMQCAGLTNTLQELFQTLLRS